MMAGINFLTVQFKSGGQAITDLLGGHSDWMLEEQGQDLALQGPAEFGKFMAAESAKWGKVIKEGNIKVE